jgi:hypothetical protein
MESAELAHHKKWHDQGRVWFQRAVLFGFGGEEEIMAKHTTKQPPSHEKPAPPKRKFYDEEDEAETEVETTEPTPPPPAAKEAPWDVPPEPPVPAPPPVDIVRRSVDEEMATPTPRETELADLAKKNAQIQAQRYDITSKNQKAIRVIHDYSGRPIEFQPGQTRTGVWLQPQTAEMLGHTDLDVKPSA